MVEHATIVAFEKRTPEHWQKYIFKKEKKTEPLNSEIQLPWKNRLCTIIIRNRKSLIAKCAYTHKEFVLVTEASSAQMELQGTEHR